MPDELQWSTDEMGRSEGDTRGPKPGDGAVVHHQSGELDFDGTSGDELPLRRPPEPDVPPSAGRPEG